MDEQAVLIIMVGMLLVTYLRRLLPVLLFSSRDLPPMIIRMVALCTCGCIVCDVVAFPDPGR